MDSIAESGHAGQTRKDGVTPYINHPRQVAATFGEREHSLKMVALGHDLFEDTKVTAEELLAKGIPEYIVDAIKILTKKEGESYETYLYWVKGNFLARNVKIADMIANLSGSPSRNKVREYSAGLKFLLFS